MQDISRCVQCVGICIRVYARLSLSLRGTATPVECTHLCTCVCARMWCMRVRARMRVCVSRWVCGICVMYLDQDCNAATGGVHTYVCVYICIVCVYVCVCV